MATDMDKFNALFGFPPGRFPALHMNDVTRTHKPATATRVAALPPSVVARFDRDNARDLALYAWLLDGYAPTWDAPPV